MSEQKMIAERYMVVTSLGEGGMADVYLAIDTILNREVAVKVLRGEMGKDPVALLRFQREASAVSKLHHPNVVEVYDVGEYQGKNYIVMEYIRGKTLKQLIQQRGALNKEEAVSIMKQLVSAVNHAHENNIVHRDIKPQNILVKDDGTVKITDFGIAIAHDSVQLTQSDSVLGSAHYIAPETTRGEAATSQVDIYALGIVFYELLTGSVPFNGENPVQIAMKHLREEMPSVREFNPTIPQSVENIIIKATAKNKINRYASAKDMLFDLDVCLLPQFANVEKVTFDDHDDTNSGTRVFKGTQVPEKKPPVEEAEPQRLKPAKNKNKSRKIIAIVALVLLLLAGTTLGVYYSGLIDGFGPTEYVNVPDLSELSKSEASEELANKGLELNSNIKEKVTDNAADGTVVEQSPAAGKRVSKGSKITITISSGNYYVIKDYTGDNISKVESELEEHKINVIKKYQATSSDAAGTILEQSLLYKGDKVKPGVTKDIQFVIAQAPEFIMQDYTGAKIETAKASLEDLGAKVTLSVISTDKMSDEEKASLNKGVVIKQTPTAGTYYTQSGDAVVTLYYYQ